MQKRKISIILSVAIGLNMLSGPIVALADELQIQNQTSAKTQKNKVTVKKFSLLNFENIDKYNQRFKLENSKIKSITNNGGNYVSNTIEKSIDGDLSTHWETGIPNKDDFQNEVIIELNENTILNKIVYAARQDRAKGKGFAKDLDIYASTSESGDDFTLVCNGTYSGSTGDVVEIKFNPTEFRRLKFKYNDAHQSWASASEFMLYKEDIISDKMDRLFTDDTLSIVSEEFDNIEKINELYEEVKSHPLYEMFKEKIEDAKILVENKISYTKANVSIFDAMNSTGLDKYNEVYKMDGDNIKSITNNGRNSMGGPIQNAVDGDINTFWHTGQLNSSSFTNEVVIEFKERKYLDRIVYGNRRDQTRGFAEEFTIYGSNTTSGDTFVKLTDGAYKNTQDFIEIQFEETELKRVKFVFDKGTADWASASEIWFYNKDEVSNKMKNLFTDSNKNVVSEDFNTIEKINQLEIDVKDHALFDIFKADLEDAKILVESNKIDSTISLTSQFELYDNTAYSDTFKMNKDNILAIRNNAGHYSKQVIGHAIDDDTTTYWETNKTNNSEFNNEVEVEFKDRVTLDRIVYGARQSDTKGFAEEFEIYASNTTSGNTYTLVTTGKYNRVSGLVEAKFEPTEFKRLKFKFVKSNQNSATLNELLFYKEDKLKNMLPTIFVDGTMTNLKEEFNSKDVIDGLSTKVNSHPAKDILQIFIDRAYKIINNDFGVEQVKINVPQLGDIHGNARKNLAMSSFGTNFLTTGIVAKPGETIEVYVDAEKGEPLPQIVFSQSQGHYGKWRRNFTLTPGYNKFIVPEIFDEEWTHKANKGGAVYIVNPYTDKQQSKAPVIVIEGGMKFPVFNVGDNKDEFLEELKEYKNYMDKNPDTAVDIFEYNAPRLLFTGTASDAYQVYVNEKVDVDTSIRVWSEFTDAGFKFAGLEDNPETPNHDSTNLRTAIRVMQPFGAAYAAGDHVGIQKHVADDFLRVDKNNINGIIWGTMHEIGHQMDIPARTWGEITNNMWANEMAILNEKGCRLDYQNLYNTVGLNHSYDEVQFGDYGVSLGMFWQLELYKDGYWSEIERMYRDRKPQPKDGQEKKDIFALYSSEIIGENLTEHFERYGFSLSEECKTELKKHPDLKRKSWYINSEIMKYKGTGFSENALVKVSSKMDIENKTNTLTFEIDKENSDDLLGYEIIKNGEVIGFTRNSSFEINDIDVNENAEYNVIAYDITLGTAKNVSVKAFTPTISAEEKVTLKLREEFNPLTYVKAINYKNEDISSKLKVNSDVDVNTKGNYTVSYTVTDNDVEVTKSISVEVVSNYDYISDFEWESVETQYGNPRRNSGIKARVNNEIKEYEKGIGIHANGKIVYNLDGKEYDRFEALLGVDMTIVSQGKSSINFKIFGDGVELASTKVLKHSDNAVYVNIPVSGVKNLTIEVYNGNNGNSSDHAIIANPKLTSNNVKPNLVIEDELELVKFNSEYDLLKGITASDVEDGNLVDSIQINSNGFTTTKTGEYEINYSVTDSDNNTVSASKKVIVYSGETYASDTEWVSAVSGWKTVNKDSAVNTTNKIKLKIDGEIKEFDKGIGAATNAEIIYDLNEKDYSYFSTYVGTDKNYDDNRTTIKFKIFADGEEVYTSDVIRKDSESEYIFIPLTGVKELKLVADNVEGNGVGDFASWADTKFYKTNSKPTLEIEDSIVTKLGLPIENIIGEFKAIDNEDGDITGNVVVSGDANFNKAGVYPITYTVIDSDGNETTKTREIKVVDMNDSIYLSDIDWKSAVNSYGKATKDISASGNTLRLTGENGEEVSYEKGIGTHSTSTIIYDLTKGNYGYFTTFVGVDRQMYGRVGSVAFEVWLDNIKVHDTGVINSTDPKKFIEINLKDAKELKLVVTDGGNGNASDHATFGDAKLHEVNINAMEVNRNKLDALIEEVTALDPNNYTEESFNNMITVKESVCESLKDGYNQVEIDRLLKELTEAKTNLVEIVNYDILEETINGTKDFKEYLYTKESYSDFKISLEKAEKIVIDKNSTNLRVNEMVTELKDKIDLLKIFHDKDKLEKEVEEANKITSIDMIGEIDNREYLWEDFVENRMYAIEVLFDTNATYQDINSVRMFLDKSMIELKIK